MSAFFAQVRRAGTLTCVFAVVAALIAVPAEASGVDPTMCRSDNSRLTIPGDFVIDGCFDGRVLYLRNTSDIVVRVEATGGVADPRRTWPAVPALASVVIASRTGQLTIPPGFLVEFPVGDREARLHVGSDPSNQLYLLARVIVGILPVKPLTIYEALSSLVDDLKGHLRTVVTCFMNNNVVGDAGCALAYTWGVTISLGKFAGRTGIALAGSKVTNLLLNLVETVAWANSATGDVAGLAHGTRDLRIPAVPQPKPQPKPQPTPPQPTPPQPPAQLPGHNGSGQVPSPTPVQPPPAKCAAFTVYAQNRWNPNGAALRGAPDHTSPKLGGFTGNTPLSVDGWTYGSTPYPNNPAPFNSNVWFHLSNGSGWVSFPGVRGAPTSYDPASNDGGPAAPVRPECKR